MSIKDDMENSNDSKVLIYRRGITEESKSKPRRIIEVDRYIHS